MLRPPPQPPSRFLFLKPPCLRSTTAIATATRTRWATTAMNNINEQLMQMKKDWWESEGNQWKITKELGEQGKPIKKQGKPRAMESNENIRENKEHQWNNKENQWTTEEKVEKMQENQWKKQRTCEEHTGKPMNKQGKCRKTNGKQRRKWEKHRKTNGNTKNMRHMQENQWRNKRTSEENAGQPMTKQGKCRKTNGQANQMVEYGK